MSSLSVSRSVRMKTHELAGQLELLASLLRTLPNTEVEASFQNTLLPQAPEKEKDNKGKESGATDLPSGVAEKLTSLSPVEIEEFLKSEAQSFSSAALSGIAQTLGIPTSKRQSKDALINAITRHFEAGQMDMMIRNRKQDEF